MVNSGLLNDYWRQYRQKRIATGTPMSYSQSIGAMDAGLAQERDLARISADRAFRDKQLQMQQDQIKKQDKAATISGIANLGQMAGSMYLGKGLLDVYKGNAAGQPLTGAATSAGESLTGALPPPGNLVEAGSVNGPVDTGAIPMASSAPAVAPSMWAVGGQAAGLMAAQMATADLLEKPAEKLGLDYTQKFGKYGGVPGIGVGLPLDIGKKVVDLGKDLINSIF